MTKTMVFNGVDMSRFIKIKDIIRPIGNKRSVTFDNAPSLGVNIQQVKRGEKEHTIKFDMIERDGAALERLKHELAGVLNVLEPVKVVYGDEPDKYYLGLPVDEITPENLTRWFQRSEFKLVIPDGVAHSSVYKKFDSIANATVTGNKMVFDLVNNGTVPANPIVKVKHNADNGYIGIANNTGSFEIGNSEDAFTEPSQKSEMLLNYRDNEISNGFIKALKNQAVTNDNTEYVVGTAEMVNLWDRSHIRLKDLRGETKLHNYATSLSWDIPANSAKTTGSLDDYLWWRQVFWAEANNQYGFIKITVSDTAGKFLYGVETFKRNLSSDCEYNFFVSDGNGGYRILGRWRFDGTTTADRNPFSVAKGWSDLKRNDDRIQVFYDGSYSTFIIPEIKGKKSARIHVTIGAYRDHPMVSHMYLGGFYYRKDFVTQTRDIPNRFTTGSNVVINSEDDTVYIDDIAKASEVVDGSQWLSIPPGNSKLELYFSSFIKKHPTVTIEFEERWL